MGGVEHVELVALDRPAAVNDLDGATGVARDDQLGAEGEVLGVGGDEAAVVIGHVVAAGGDALGGLAAALGAGAVGGHFHADRAELLGDGRGGQGGGGGGRVVHQFGRAGGGGDRSGGGDNNRL